MWRSFLTVGSRAMLNNKVYAFVNVASLTLGLAAAILTLLYVLHETRYDRWLPASDRIVQLQTIVSPRDGEASRTAMAPRVAVEQLRREFPEFEQVVGMMKSRTAIVHEGEARYSDILWADPNVFKVFDLPLLEGDPETALRDVNSVVLTEAEAERYFGSVKDAVGQILSVNRYGQDQPLRVTAVLAGLPEATHLKLGMIARFNPDIEVDYFLTNWGATSGYVYGLLRPGASVAGLNARMPAFEARNLPPPEKDGAQSRDELLDFRFVGVRDIHLGASHEGSMRPGGDPLAVTGFAIVSLFILVIACANFTNLTTARASLRAREIGIRKVLGATRRQLVAQFLGEAMLVTAFAALLALALVELLLPSFNGLLGAELSLAYLGEGGILLPAVLLIALVGLVGGAYPAFYLSHFHPARVLNASPSGVAQGSGRLRTALVVAQFAISITLTICASIVYTQTLHAQAADPGYARGGVLVLQGLHPGTLDRRQPLTAAIERLPGVRSTAFTGIVPGEDVTGSTSVRLVGRPTDEQIGFATVDYGFFETMGIEPLAGRTLSERFARDDGSVDFLPSTPDEQQLLARGMNILINAAAARRLGFSEPSAAVGAELTAELIEEGSVPVTVVGVVPDVRFGSLRDPVKPLLYRRLEMGLGQMVVRYSGEAPSRVRERVEGAWRRVLPDVPFEAVLVEDELAGMYEADAVRGRVFAIASALAVLIACMGLFGLAAFAVERRRLEIAIRKAFGARDAAIVRLMIWQFSRPVLIANLIAWPVAWWLMRDWLNGFADRIALHPGWFLGAGTLALAIAVLTVGGQSFRASRTRPALALRYE